ncbi:ATP synthase subunit I [bacterium]|nr:MAG: ATP synthase subunit I [bacterium]
MNSPAVSLVLAVAAGLVLGLFYFGGLWLTVRRLVLCKKPGLLMFSSFVVRTFFSLGGLYLVMAGDWQRLLACLAGFLLVRFLLVRVLGPVGHPVSDAAQSGRLTWS